MMLPAYDNANEIQQRDKREGIVSMNSTLHAKVDQLKQVEMDCYRINYYLLQNEHDALKVTEHMLLQLAEDEAFFQRSEDDQMRTLLKRSIHYALNWKKACKEVI